LSKNQGVFQKSCDKIIDTFGHLNTKNPYTGVQGLKKKKADVMADNVG